MQVSICLQPAEIKVEGIVRGLGALRAEQANRRDPAHDRVASYQMERDPGTRTQTVARLDSVDDITRDAGPRTLRGRRCGDLMGSFAGSPLTAGCAQVRFRGIVPPSGRHASVVRRTGNENLESFGPANAIPCGYVGFEIVDSVICVT